MKIIKLLLLLLGFIGSFSCKKDQNIDFEKVFLKEESPDLEINQVFHKVELMELSFDNEGEWIGYIDQYKIAGDHIFLLDESQGQKIAKFDLLGNYVSEINSVGDSPEGFNKPSLLSIDESKNELVIFDRTLLKFVFYDMDFNYLRSEKIDKYYSGIAHSKSGDGLLLFPDDIISESDGFVLVYKNINEKNESILHTKYQIIPHLSEKIFYNDHSSFYHLPFEDKIFRFGPKDGKFVPLFQLMLNTDEIPEELLNENDILALQSHLLESQKNFVSFNGTEFNGYYYLFYHRDLESYNFVKINKTDFSDNVSVSWEGLFRNANVPVPFGSGDDFYYAVDYLSKSDYEKVIELMGIHQKSVEFPDFKEKLFLFKFYLR
ncbi:6-bladed beta-propeller [Aquiflexum sp. LQ15W]|uniref:6-bladed beta-propeller n=1 Tax=Cognataquiflexum nitidum TaxID=2922272 RepID=UPI001F141A70|nr:6-bladed beta-propeller [Cognataquiflexum nitidum]MCH6199348.1 6-bladed beta-propeller [Cognataquiflexum nitidum]